MNNKGTTTWRAVLIVADEVASASVVGRLLTLDGVRVDSAVSESAALYLLDENVYDLIVLARRSPDAAGRVLLDRVQAANPTVPVLVLTLSTEWVYTAALLREIAASTLLKRPAALHHGGCVAKVSAAGHDVLIARVLPTLLDPSTAIPVFLMCASALRVQRSSSADPRRLLEQLEYQLLQAGAAPRAAEPRVVQALQRLEDAVRRGAHVCEESIARVLYVDRAHLGRLLFRHTGLRFREWRRAFLIREAVQALCLRQLRVSEVAHRLGRPHSQLDREFRQLCGLSPREFRSLAASVMQPPDGHSSRRRARPDQVADDRGPGIHFIDTADTSLP